MVRPDLIADCPLHALPDRQAGLPALPASKEPGVQQAPGKGASVADHRDCPIHHAELLLPGGCAECDLPPGYNLPVDTAASRRQDTQRYIERADM